MLKNSSKYQIIKSEHFSYEDYVLVSTYYQPVIGPVATLIYVNFLNEIVNNNSNTEIPISKLQVYINTSIDKIYFAIKILVKANLIEIFKSSEEDRFVFKINKPYNKEEFFKEESLSEILLQQVGEQLFEQIKNFERSTIHHLPNNPVEEPVVNQQSVIKNPYLKYFMELKLGNSEEEIAEIVRVSELNKLTKIEIETILPISKDGNAIVIEKYNKALGVIREKPKAVNVVETVATKDDVLAVFDKYDSELFLSKLSGGRELTISEQKLIYTLRADYKLVDPVINVLIDYVLLINDKNLNRNFVEAIAANWSRKGFSTSTQAMEFVKNYNKKKNESAVENQANIRPEWLDNQTNTTPKSVKPNNDEKFTIIEDNVNISAEYVDKTTVKEEAVELETIYTKETINMKEIEEEPFDIFSNFEGE